MSDVLIPFHLPLAPQLPNIQGNADYRAFRDQLLRVDQLLTQGDLERDFLQRDLARWSAGHSTPSPRAQQGRLEHSRRALRCNLAALLIGEDYRGLAARLADSPLLQHFCGLAEIERVRVPSKSTLQRYSERWEESEVRELAERILRTGMQEPEKLDLAQPLDLDTYFLDTTCIGADIHFPVDWLLLRDATRTLISAVAAIRTQGLKHRMEPPESFTSRMNHLCMAMTHTGTTPEGQRRRKRILRQMDRLVGTVRGHAQRYRDLLDRDWAQTQWTRPQAEQVLRRIDGVLALLPQARRQARQRILDGEKVENKDKILSLYEPEVRVIVRNKAGAAVEFGNTLRVGESPQGLIVDWQLYRESAPADAKLLPESIACVTRLLGHPPKGGVGTDRGFDSADNRQLLEEQKIFNAMCPRSPKTLHQRNASWKFRKLQRRRSQTEARIAILTNVFLGQPVPRKGFARRELAVNWAVLTHNLWVLARLPRRAQAQALAA